MQSRFLARWFDPADGTPRDRAVWLVLSAVLSTLLLAFWAVCNSQVHKAEARHAAQPLPSIEDCDPNFAVPSLGHCPAGRTVVGSR